MTYPPNQQQTQYDQSQYGQQAYGQQGGYPQYQQQGYPGQGAVQAKNSPMALTGFILALSGLFLFWIPYIGWLLPIAGLIFSIVGTSQVKKSGGAYTGKGLAVAGIIISSVALLIMILVIVIAGAVIMSMMGM